MFRVEWLQSALNEMADAWVRATPEERQAITLAAHAVDRRLSEDAATRVSRDTPGVGLLLSRRWP